MKKIAVLLAEGFEEVEAVTPIDFLRRADIDVTVTGVTGREVTGARDIVFRTDKEIGDLAGAAGDFDGVVLPGGMPGASNLAASREVGGLVTALFSAGKMVAAICAAPAVVLQPLGIVKGKRVTCYPGFEERFEGAQFQEKRVVLDGNLITSEGPGTAAEFAVEIIRYLAGQEAADNIHKATLQK